MPVNRKLAQNVYRQLGRRWSPALSFNFEQDDMNKGNVIYYPLDFFSALVTIGTGLQSLPVEKPTPVV